MCSTLHTLVRLKLVYYLNHIRQVFIMIDANIKKLNKNMGLFKYDS